MSSIARKELILNLTTFVQSNHAWTHVQGHECMHTYKTQTYTRLRTCANVCIHFWACASSVFMHLVCTQKSSTRRQKCTCDSVLSTSERSDLLWSRSQRTEPTDRVDNVVRENRLGWGAELAVKSPCASFSSAFVNIWIASTRPMSLCSCK